MSALARTVAATALPAGGTRGSVPPLWRRVLMERATLSGGFLVAVLLLIALPAPFLTPYDPLRGTNPQFLPPLTGDHWLGTTASGRDLFAILAHGGRVSLSVGLAVALLSTVIGILVGSVAGYVGTWTDDVLMRISDLFLVVPRFFMALVVVAIFGHGLLNIVIVLTILSWPPVSRIVRAEFLSLKEREFVQAARIIGSPGPRIVVREILPNAMGPAIVVGSLQISQAILAEASLAFIGLGDPDLASWGAVLADAQRYLGLAPWIAVIPGLAISVAVIGFNLIGDGLARALDPRASRAVSAEAPRGGR